MEEHSLFVRSNLIKPNFVEALVQGVFFVGFIRRLSHAAQKLNTVGLLKMVEERVCSVIEITERNGDSCVIANGLVFRCRFRHGRMVDILGRLTANTDADVMQFVSELTRTFGDAKITIYGATGHTLFTSRGNYKYVGIPGRLERSWDWQIALCSIVLAVLVIQVLAIRLFL